MNYACLVLSGILRYKTMDYNLKYFPKNYPLCRLVVEKFGLVNHYLLKVPKVVEARN